MPHLDLTRLRCPSCRGLLTNDGPDAVACRQDHRFPIVDGIAELLPSAVLQATDAVSVSKQHEREAHDAHAADLDYALPVDERHLFSWLNYYQLFALKPRLLASRPASILVAMVGPGFELAIWRTIATDVSGVDISTGLVRLAARRAAQLGLAGTYVAGDIEHLPFADASFDLVVVHHGLHHLPSLEAALGELLRVSRRQCVLCEPVDGPMRRWLRRTGISPDVEPEGTRVCDVRAEDVARIAAAHGARLTVADRLFYPRARVVRPTPAWELADRLRVPQLLRWPLAAFNAMFGRWVGTKGTFVIERVVTASDVAGTPGR